MIIYIDHQNKRVFLTAPKCGSTTISSHLNVSLHETYSDACMINILSNNEYLKIIVIRTDVVGRFLSGFTEDLYSNECYANLHLTFIGYIKFLYHCYTKKIKHVNNLNVFFSRDIPIYFGGNDTCKLPITGENGEFVSHIQTQKYALGNLIDIITGTNVKLLNINELSRFLGNNESKNVKRKFESNSCADMLYLCDLKRIGSMVSKKMLSAECYRMILDMCKDDLEFIKNLEKKFEYIHP
jgi:hypothetical protein